MHDDDPIAKVCYEQNFEQARSLNTQMNQVPVLAMTLTGGLWFAAGVTEHLDTGIRFALLTFAGFCDLAFVLAILRIRDVLESYFEKLEQFSPPHFASGEPNKPKISWLGRYSMVTIYGSLMLMAAIASFFGGFWKYWPLPEQLRYEGVGALILLLLAIFVVSRATANGPPKRSKHAH